MVPTLFFYGLVLVALVWLFLKLYWLSIGCDRSIPKPYAACYSC